MRPFLPFALVALGAASLCAQVPLSGVYSGTSQGTRVTVGPPQVATPTSEGFSFEIKYGAIAHTGTFQAGEVTVTSSGTLAADGTFRYTFVSQFLFSVRVTTEYSGRLVLQPGGQTAVGSGTYTQRTVTPSGDLFSSVSDGTWSVTAPVTFPTGAGRLTNVSTRGSVETGDAIMIAGLVIEGTQPKRLVLRALGPSLVPFGISNALSNPSFRLFRGAEEIAANDDWATDARAAEVTAASLAPGDAREAALAVTLAPGLYTVLVAGVGGATGIAIVEAYDLDNANDDGRISNLSTRASVRLGEGQEIVGFAIRGGPRRVLIRGLGPTFQSFFSNYLTNPTLSLFNSAGQALASNDSWTTADNAGAIQQSGLAPGQSAEAALLLQLQPGNYTAILSGVGGAVGIGSVEIYEVP
ncbi:MAG: hypothetical protein JSR82_04130 [Verrucomicrobia bacterium]|nr:hypothetical protein [Verrucomicrobiota bacterium]